MAKKLSPTKKRWLIIGICGVFVFIIFISIFTINNNLRNERVEKINSIQKKIDDIQPTLNVLKIAINHRTKVQTAVSKALRVMSYDKINQGISSGWIVGCGDENGEECIALKACNEKQDLIDWDELAKIQERLAAMDANLRRDVESWLSMNTIQKTGFCAAGYWSGSSSDLKASEDATNVLAGHANLINKKIDLYKNDKNKLLSSTYFLWFKL